MSDLLKRLDAALEEYPQMTYQPHALLSDSFNEIVRLNDEAATLRQQLEQAQARVAESTQEWFYRGAAATLAMFDTKSTEYHEAVCQHGGYWVLIKCAENYDREHLLEAAEYHEGKAKAQRLRQQADEIEPRGNKT